MFSCYACIFLRTKCFQITCRSVTLTLTLGSKDLCFAETNLVWNMLTCWKFTISLYCEENQSEQFVSHVCFFIFIFFKFHPEVGKIVPKEKTVFSYSLLAEGWYNVVLVLCICCVESWLCTYRMVLIQTAYSFPLLILCCTYSSKK